MKSWTVVGVLACAACSSSTPSQSVETPATGFDGGFTSFEGGIVGADSGTGTIQSECVPPTKGPTTHGGSVNADETWTADTSPHILPYDTSVYKTLTIEPCAEVLIGENHFLTITATGKLLAEGSATKRIHFGNKDAGKAFATISSNKASLRFAYTTIDGGGAPLNTYPYLAGTVNVQGDNLLPTQELLFVNHVDVSGSASNGIVLREGAGFAAGSVSLTVSGSVAHPLSVGARSVGGIPLGKYTGNTFDKILLPTTSGNETINESTTLRERGVPYLVGHATSGGDLRVDTTVPSAPVTLTIEPGVTMRFKKGGVLRVHVATGTGLPAPASLFAQGTADKNIVFTSDENGPAAGDWLGIRFGGDPTAVSKIDYARVEYAGGASTSGSGSCPDNSELMNDAAIRVYGAPISEFVTNTTILASATNGIDRGWRSDNPIVDFLPTNTFTNVALCQQTYPPTAANVCPSIVPCPM